MDGALGNAPSVGVSRYVAASLALGVYLSGALGLASGLGSAHEVGLDRLREHAVLLLLSGGVGVYGMSTFLLLTRRRVWSPWLLLGLLPGSAVALLHAGVIA